MVTLAPARTPVVNLPPDLTSFVDRRHEVSEVKRLLSVSRLVTLTGVGGVGKTRLALRVAMDLRRAFRDGVWLVELGKLHEPDLVVHTVAAALGLREQGPVLDTLTEYLAPRHLLLVLDNCEHLVDVCASTVDRLLRTCPDVHVLATSREALRLDGETTMPVAALSVLDPQQSASSRSASPAVTLFCERASAVAPRFRLTEDNQETVARICGKLDGLPLAIELAAVLVRVLSPNQMLERLSNRYRLLTKGSRTAPDRHQTLLASIEWSFDLCSPRERVLWSRLSVFEGFELDAVEDVCSGEGIAREEMLELVTSLVDKSVLTRTEHAGVTRFQLLPTLREFGAAKARESGEHGRLRRRHRDWCEGLVRRADEEWVSDRQPSWFGRLDREHPNIQLALDFCLTERGEAESALRILVHLWHFYWWGRGWGGEGRHWLGHALDLADHASPVRLRAVLFDSMLAMSRGDLETALRLLAEGRELATGLGGAANLSLCGYVAGNAAMYAGDVPGAITMLEEALEVLPDTADLSQRLDLLLAFAIASGLAGDADRAVFCHRQVLALTEPVGERFHRSYSLWALGLLVQEQGDLARANELQRRGLRLKEGLDDRIGTAWCVESMAWLAAADDQPERAATLLGAADAFWRNMGTPVSAYQHLMVHHDACRRRSEQALGEQRFHAAFRRGAELEDVVGYALEEQTRVPPHRDTAAPSPLTPREREVASLVGKGLSNKDIAATLVISPRTAETHVENILTKLGFTSRSQIATWVIPVDDGGTPRAPG